MEKGKVLAQCVCENCRPKKNYTKNEFFSKRFRCPNCETALNLMLCEQGKGEGEEYSTDYVSVNTLKIGDYICIDRYFYRISNIKEDEIKKGNLYISAYNYGSRSYKKNDAVWKLKL